MKKIKYVPALLVALSVPLFMASAFASPITSQSAWDVKQALSENYARSVSINSAKDGGWQRSSISTGISAFNHSYRDSFFSRNDGEGNNFRAELQQLLSNALAKCSSQAKAMVVDMPAISLQSEVVAGTIAVAGVPTTSVPEPGSLALLGAGMAGIMVMRRRAKTAR